MNSHLSKRNLEINEEKYNGDDTSSSSSFCISINEESANSEQAVGYSLHSSNSQSRKISKKKRDGNLYDFLFNQSNDDEDSHLLELVASHNKTKNYISDKPDEIQEHILDYLDIVSAINLSFCSKSYYRLFINYVDNEKIAKNIIELCVASQKIEFFSSLLQLITETVQQAVKHEQDLENQRCIKKSTIKTILSAIGALIPGPLIHQIGWTQLNTAFAQYYSLTSSLRKQAENVFKALLASCGLTLTELKIMDSSCGEYPTYPYCNTWYPGCNSSTQLLCDEKYRPLCESLFEAEDKNPHAALPVAVMLIGMGLTGIGLFLVLFKYQNGYFDKKEIDFLKKQIGKIISIDNTSKKVIEFLAKNNPITTKTSALKIKELLEKQLAPLEAKIERILNKPPFKKILRQRPRNHLSNMSIYPFFKTPPKKTPKDNFQLLLNNSSAEEPVVPRFLFQ